MKALMAVAAIMLAGCQSPPQVPPPTVNSPLPHDHCWAYANGQVDAADPFELLKVNGVNEWMYLSRGEFARLAIHNVADMGRAIGTRTEKFDAIYRICMWNIGQVPLR